MMKTNKINNSSWEIEVNSPDTIRKAGVELCGAAFSDDIGKIDEHTPEDHRGNEIYFAVRFDGLLIEFLTKRELYMFGLALQLAADAIPIQLIGMIPTKAMN